MPYIPTETVKVKRNLLKKLLPEWKLSVTTQHHSKINVALMAGPLDIDWDNKKYPGHEDVNHFYIESHYKEQPELCKVLMTIKNVVSSEQKEIVYDGDYGSVPNYYVGIEIGKWDKDYKVIKK
jgi:hypothetical protein